MDREILDKKEWLEQSLQIHISKFKKKKNVNKRKAFFSNILVASFGLITTALLGTSLMIVHPYLKIASIILAIIITIISSINIFFNFSSLWTRYTMTLNHLYHIKDDLEYYLAGKIQKDIKINDLEKFKRRLQKVLNYTNNYWENLNNK